MPGSTTALSISTLPRFLHTVHNLRSASLGAKRAFSTSYYSDRTRPSLQRRCGSSSSFSHNEAAASHSITTFELGPQKLWRRYQSTESSAANQTPSPKSQPETKPKRTSPRSSAAKKPRSPKDRPEAKRKRTSEKDLTSDKDRKPWRGFSKKKKKKSQKATAPEKPPKKLEPWEIQKAALKEKFQDGWNPRRKLSPDAMDGVRQLHKSDPVKFSTPVLAEHFKVSPEAIRRILKSKWRPSEEVLREKQERWEQRGAKIWNQMAELGLRPQRQGIAPLSDFEALKGRPKR